MTVLDNPFVSVAVITYNSSFTVIETLNSILDQTYENIELIISDDCSTDNTVTVCREWLSKHGSRFIRSELITTDTNTGISRNLNRAAAACKGEWIKDIAGDDILLPDCIECYMRYVSEHPDTKLLFSKIKCFGASELECRQRESIVDYSFFNMTSEEQMHRLIFEGNGLPAPTVFYKSDIAIKFDERIPLLEDWPRWINLLKANIKFELIDKQLVCYRVNDKLTYNPKYLKSLFLFDLHYRYPVWKKECPADAERMLADTMDETFANAANARRAYQTKAYLLGTTILRPFRWIKNCLLSNRWGGDKINC